jgi:hypothetical protein
MAMTREQELLLRKWLDSDHPPPGRGPSASARRIGTWAYVAEFGEDGTLTSLTVEEDLAITRDLVNEEGNCLGCWLPYDSTISHGHPVCRSKVTISGDGRE